MFKLTEKVFVFIDGEEREGLIKEIIETDDNISYLILLYDNEGQVIVDESRLIKKR